MFEMTDEECHCGYQNCHSGLIRFTIPALCGESPKPGSKGDTRLRGYDIGEKGGSSTLSSQPKCRDLLRDVAEEVPAFVCMTKNRVISIVSVACQGLSA